MALLGSGSEAALGLYPKRTKRDAEEDEATKRRQFLAAAGLAAPLLGSQSQVRVGAIDVDRMRRKFTKLEALDSEHGGGDTFHLYFTELARTEQILHSTSRRLAVSKSLIELGAQQAQQAGWAAFDAGFIDIAVPLFDYSRSAAKEVGSRELEANSLVHIAYATGQSESIEAADAACAAVGRDAPGKAVAMLQSRLAWSFAMAGRTDAAARALDDARAGLDSGDDSPSWCSWMNHSELDIMAGRVWSVLRKPERAIPPLQRALADYPNSWARDKALYLTWLADAYLDAGDGTRAVETAGRAFALAGTVSSVRPLARVRETAQRASAAGAAGARDLACRAAAARAPIPVRL
ncbi:XRE family transcriptional regulator [Nocardia sp. SYP-A9097]|uniref:tetratricopeptide repeat protein n=1 Tax=Nocardia sp. SYP-A9097 TaxID=2663237 RepID=UPI00129ACFEA|nr:XRE family transcriptional regulator [Nocardia sp. SYP-A9097]MRH89111.1 XRE family transcriptional regulator [Nocardia sp. SYP-A9097]